MSFLLFVIKDDYLLLLKCVLVNLDDAMMVEIRLDELSLTRKYTYF
jgi:hypothetical protein